MDSFQVHAAVYDIPKTDYQSTLDELVELLDLSGVLKKQVRTLSLGERMKCEICVSLLHRPEILFLDEPTIGVDIEMQARIRQFISEYNAKHGATIILTSHYMADVTALCKRIIVIDHGKLLFDGSLDALSARMAVIRPITSSRPMTTTSVVSLKSPMKVLTMFGIETFSACGMMISWVACQTRDSKHLAPASSINAKCG